jgi:hypothetical protein
VKSSGKSFSIGSSVDPGLPKIVVIPWARKSSNVASRTLAMSADANRIGAPPMFPTASAAIIAGRAN